MLIKIKNFKSIVVDMFSNLDNLCLKFDPIWKQNGRASSHLKN